MIIGYLDPWGKGYQKPLKGSLRDCFCATCRLYRNL